MGSRVCLSPKGEFDRLHSAFSACSRSFAYHRSSAFTGGNNVERITGMNNSIQGSNRISASTVNAYRDSAKTQSIADEKDRERSYAGIHGYANVEHYHNAIQQTRNNQNSISRKIASETQDPHVVALHQEIEALRNEQNKRIARLEVQQKTAMGKMADTYNTLLNNVETQAEERIKAAQEEMRALLEQQNEEMKQALDDARTRLKKAQKQLEKIEIEAQGHEAVAQNCIETADFLLGNIRTNFNHSRFTPNRLEKLERNLEFARTSLQRDRAPQAAMPIARTVFSDAMELKDEVAVLQAEWNLCFSNLEIQMISLSYAFEDAENAEYTDYIINENGESEQESHTALINRFSDGKLTDAQKQFDNLRKHVLNDKDAITIEELHQAERELNEIYQKLLNARGIARVNFVMANRRGEIASEIAYVLNQQYEAELIEACYFGNQWGNNALFTKLTHQNDGVSISEFMIVITPQQNESGIVTTENIEAYIVNDGYEMQCSTENRSAELLAILSEHLPAYNFVVKEAVPNPDQQPDYIRIDLEEVKKGVWKL